MRSTKYNTKQKEAILKYLKEEKKKLKTAKDVVEYFNNSEDINIGQATIYRNLEKLVEEGKLKKYYLKNEPSACFEYIASEACSPQDYHFKCDTCVKLIHFECEEMKKIQEYLYKKYGFSILFSNEFFHGKCKTCTNKSK